MRYGSVCSGIEAASVAWHPLNWTPVFFSEIEPFPCAVLKNHYPDVPNRGDMTLHKEWPDVPIDLLVGGTPCQSFSVAGQRRGLEDERGNLALAFVNIADQYDPPFILWENVPGVLSDATNAFGCFLAALAGEDDPFVVERWAGAGMVLGRRRRVAWVTLDAQFFGVPQRRRRIFVLAVDAEFIRRVGEGASPEKILAIGECVQGDAPARGEKGFNEDAYIIKDDIGGESQLPEVLTMNGEEITPTFISRMDAKTGTTQDALVIATPKAFRKSRRAQSNEDYETWVDGDIANTINQFDVGERDTHCIVYPINTMCALGRKVDSSFDVGLHNNGDPSPTLIKAHSHRVAIAFAQNCREEIRDLGEVAGSLSAEPGTHQQTYIISDMEVRRLTPIEAERLFGFPDTYTFIPYNNKSSSDGPRYRSLGNSMAVPVMRWIGERINEVWVKTR